MLSSDHLKHASLQTSNGAWSLVSVLPLASRGTARGQAGTAPLLLILQDTMDIIPRGEMCLTYGRG